MSSLTIIVENRTNITRSNDGLTLLISSSDGFCSCLTFAPGELGTIYHPPPQTKSTAAATGTATASSAPTQVQSHAQSSMPSFPRPPSSQGQAGSPSAFAGALPPASPARSISTSSVATLMSHAQAPEQNPDPNDVVNDPTPQMSSVPSITASNTSAGGLPMFTPPQTPGYTGSASATSMPTAAAFATSSKREADVAESSGKDKRRRIQPTLVSGTENQAPPPTTVIEPPPPPPL